MMKRSVAALAPVFNTGRMVSEYMQVCYWPSAERFERLSADGLKKARELAAWRRSLKQGWPKVKVEAVEVAGAEPMHVGGELKVQARVNLGNFKPDDVNVQLFHGLVDSFENIPNPLTAPMSHNGSHDGTSWVFSGSIPCRSSGQYGYKVRVLPRNADLANAFEPGLVSWD
jgi:glycogen phosphorylase